MRIMINFEGVKLL